MSRSAVEANVRISVRIEQYESQLRSPLETLDSRIIKYFDQNGTINEENISGSDSWNIPCSILESILASDFDQINKPLVAQFLMVCSSKCDEDEEFLNELRDTFSIALEDGIHNISNIILDTYMGPYILMLMNFFLPNPVETTQIDPADMGSISTMASLIIDSHENTSTILFSEFEKYTQSGSKSDELEKFSEFKVTGILSCFFKAIALNDKEDGLFNIFPFLFQDDSCGEEFTKEAEDFLLDVMFIDDSIMISILSSLLIMDTKNTTEIDFIGLMASYLDRVNFDPEFFLTLLLECESTKVLTFLLYVYKLENISQRFDFYLEEKGRFKIFTFNLIQKLKKMKSLLHFNPEPLIRKMNKVLA